MLSAPKQGFRTLFAILIVICWLIGSATSGLAQTFQPTGNPNLSYNCVNRSNCNAESVLLPNGRVFVIGDSNASGEVYDPANGTWTLTGNINIPRSGHTTTLLQNGKVLIAGGTGASAMAEIFDPNATDPVTGRPGAFSLTGSLAIGRTGHSATLLLDGRVLIVGGDGVASVQAELYDPVNGTFALTGVLNDGRLLHTATLLLDGKVLIAGGLSGLGSGCTTHPDGFCLSAELYDPANGTFARVGDMSTRRADHTATLLTNGRVLIAGGCHEYAFRNLAGSCLASAELFDPATGLFTSTGDMTTVRFAGSETRLQDGRVFILGGTQDLGIPASTEIYDPATGTFSSSGSPLSLETVWRYPLAKLLSPRCEVLLMAGQHAELFTSVGCQGANQCQIDLQTAQQNLSTCQANLQSAQAQASQLQTDLSAANGAITTLQSQLAATNTTIGQTNAAMTASVASLQNDFRQVFGNPTFVVPGATPLQQLQNIVQAVIGLKKSSKKGVYNNLGGTP